MKILDRYIAKAVISYTLLVLFILIALYTFLQFVTELEDVGEGDYGVMGALRYTTYSIPQHIYDLLPVAALLGSVLGLGYLAGQSELVAMRAAGFSVGRITLSALATGMIFVIVTVLMGEVVAPPAQQAANKLRSLAKTGHLSEDGGQGFWSRNGNNFNHVGRVLPNGQYEYIEIFEFDDQRRLRIVTQAARAIYHKDGWHLYDVTQRLISTKGITTRRLDEALWESGLNPEMLDVVMVDPQQLSAWGLYRYIGYLQKSKQAAEQYRQAFWSKIVAPFSTLIMMFLAIPFIFGPLRSVSVGQRILVGALVGIGFFLFNRLFNQLGLVFDLPPWLGAAFPSLLCLALGVVMLRRIY
ncbi:LPS export ABC transporter permease LptG [Nitrosococcus oceani]|uniref:Permease YjgP/YjgQ n=2 Tax=Nitrosococcus oceani TaxID=1229 RepID=Q3J9X3_NITOC|nr:LPS export ABC transporter permease LptG [Nitrosococcus oceani]KFI19179.1 permease [Nitrosococcus oceani C-27]ABA58373.1 permease YjgP/YjgQ [Nitrosococcus oceani ATCC 19707]EDZ67608.1 putative permease, YjgP/YjgQ family [Nitrosococcus oceani AFC27]KFI22400.1 permease [Nitrosococcus oceani]GEM18764.1 LPS export ABC transporter permease LptG [Nitrosococcus oceani]